MTMINVTIIENDKEYLKDLKAVLRGSNTTKVVGAFLTGKRALASISKTPPDVVLVCIEHPFTSGVSIIKKIKGFSHKINILALTKSNNKKHILSSFKAGAEGYMLKGTKAEDLIKAIGEVYKGHLSMSDEINRCVLQELYKVVGKKKKRSVDLTSREKQVLSLLSKGHQQKEIGDGLSIKHESVRSHLKHIYKKLKAHSMHDALVKAKDKGLI